MHEEDNDQLEFESEVREPFQGEDSRTANSNKNLSLRYEKSNTFALHFPSPFAIIKIAIPSKKGTPI